jgi:hypothetical protein
VYAVVGRSLLTAEERRSLGIRRIFAIAEMDDADPSNDPDLSRRLAESAGAAIGRLLHDQSRP